jgi:hypothetical protein
MSGTIVANVFFIESNGVSDPNTYTWPQGVIDDVKLQMIDTWSIWSYTAGLYGHTVTAVMNWYEPSGGMTLQPYEPITRPSTDDGLWINAIMANLAVPGAGAFKPPRCLPSRSAWLVPGRSRLQRVHCLQPACAGAPSQFTDGKIGYAYLGGPYTQLLYKANGWPRAMSIVFMATRPVTSSTRSTSTPARLPAIARAPSTAS